MTATPVGIPDSAAGAGVAELLTMDVPFGLPASLSASKIQPVDTLPAGDPWNWVVRSASYTPGLQAALTAMPIIAASKVPDGELLVVDAAQIINYAADETFLRIIRRYPVYHHNFASPPGTGAAPAVAVAANPVGMNDDALTRSYKYAAVDAGGKEGPLSAASAAIATTVGNRAVTVTLPALSTGAVAFNVYRTIGGQAATGPWYQVDQEVTTSFLDVRPDAHLSSIQHGGVTWDTNPHTWLAPEAGELVFEVFTPITQFPTRVIYVNDKGRNEAVTITAGTLTAGTRYRIPFRGEARAFTAAAGATPANMPVDQKFSEFGAKGVAGFGTLMSSIQGQVVVWCEVGVGTTDFLTVPAAGSINRAEFTRPAVFPPGSELALSVGNTAAAAAGVREVRVQGRSYTIPTT